MTSFSSPANSGATDLSSGNRFSWGLLGNLLRSEWTKLRSVPSTYWTLLTAVVATVGLGALICAIYVSRYGKPSPFHRTIFNPTSYSLSGVMLAQLAIVVLGVLVITSEYSTGLIRTTFTAVPHRLTLFLAKALVFTAATLVIGIVSCFAAFFVGQSILSGHNLQTTLGSSGVLRAVIGAGLYLAVLGLLSLALGAMLRSTAGAIATVVGLLLVLPGIIAALPKSWTNAIDKYLPSNAGQAIFHVQTQAHMFSPWAGFALFCGYTAVALIAAGYLMRRRDA
ncbi:MAG: ABC transporter permease [Candidatus Dormiibacterota bacterium]